MRNIISKPNVSLAVIISSPKLVYYLYPMLSCGTPPPVTVVPHIAAYTYLPMIKYSNGETKLTKMGALYARALRGAKVWTKVHISSTRVEM